MHPIGLKVTCRSACRGRALDSRGIAQIDSLPLLRAERRSEDDARGPRGRGLEAVRDDERQRLFKGNS